MRTSLIVIFTFLLNINFTFSQRKHTFYFSMNDKAYEGKYSSRKFTEEQIYNVFTYLLNYDEFEYSVAPASFRDVPLLSEKALKGNIDYYFSVYNQLLLPNIEFWEKIRQERIHYLLERGKYREITLKAYSNPANLLEFDVPNFSQANYYRKLILSTDTAQMADAVCDLQEVYLGKLIEETDDIDKLRYYLISLGWYSEAQKYLPHLTDSTILQNHFLKLFKKVGVRD